jgi:hypothetical protein
VLLHLSETNNTPEVAERTVAGLARRGGYRGPVAAAPGRVPAEAFVLGARRPGATRPYIPPASRPATALVAQLELAI